MNKRPLAVTLISWLYIITGVAGLAFHLSKYKIQHPLEYDIVWIAIVEILAMIAGGYMLRGKNWARWLAIAWMAFHVIISVRGPLDQLIVHSLLLLVFAYFLFNRTAKRYFSSGYQAR
ncbi:MAG TPA: hypothetical protein VGF44_15765 [Terriglobales bacterium]|jgi:hypothetical protein